MHLLLPGQAPIDDGEEAFDLGQAPADHLILSFADTELTALADLMRSRTAASVRLANMKLLRHPMSVDLYVEKTARHARTITVRALGGAGYFGYGLDRLAAVARAEGIRLAVIPGDDKLDPALSSYSTVEAEDADRLWRYFSEGGAGNLGNALGFLDHLAGMGDMPPPPAPIPRFGLYWPDGEPASADALLARQAEGQGTAAIVFYRALLQGQSTAPIDALIEALNARGLAALPLYVSSLKSAEDDLFVRALFEAHPPDVVLNTTAFAISKAGADHTATALDATGAPVLQVILSGLSEEAWTASDRGLPPRDLAMHVVLPEVDGRIHTRAVAFKDAAETDPATGTRMIRSKPRADRIDFVADFACSWVRLGRTPRAERRIGLVLHNYPNKDSRIGNGVGLDTPASAVAILDALKSGGYTIENAPETSADLMRTILTGQTNDGRYAGTSTVTLSLSEYRQASENFPETIRNAVMDRWGNPEADPFVHAGAFHLPAHTCGAVAVMVQPARGYNIDPKATYHDPALVPPHGYFATYLWLRERFGAHAVIHLGKHGTLEWLPGKATALSADCYPEAVFGALPQLYPFIVNDPGEGAQAKRRTGAVIVDHMTPPMARAESHGVALRLETLLDEFAQAESMDPARAANLRRDILNLARDNGFDRDIGGFDLADPDLLVALDSHLCDLKELQIRDGLHVFGASPEGTIRTAHLAALARVPRPGEALHAASLHRAMAADLEFEDFDPLDCEMGAPHDASRPAMLANISDDPWRTNGDTIERIELLAECLISGDTPCPTDWSRTRAVLDWIDTALAPRLEACGASEIAALMAGLDGRFVPPGPSGAPTRGRPDVLPTGRNFYAVDVRAVPSRAAWDLGKASAERLVMRYFQDEGEWPRALALSAWGTSNMRTGGDDIAQALALIGAKPVWEDTSSRVTGYEIIPLGELKRPRVDVTLRISGFFRDAFPHLIQLFDSAVAGIATLDEPDEANPIAAAVRAKRTELEEAGAKPDDAARQARHRVFGAKPGAYGAGLQTLIDEGIWQDRADFADAFLTWGGYAYGAGVEGDAARGLLEARLAEADAVVHNQDNREHDLLDSDDYYQFEGGLAATVEHLSGAAPRVYHTDHSRPERPVVRALSEEIGRVVRGRAANPKWIAGVMRHGYKGAFEIAATVDYLFAFAATTNAVGDHHFDQLYDAYIADEAVRDFIARENPPALADIAARLAEAIDRDLWSPRLNSAYASLNRLASAPDMLKETGT